MLRESFICGMTRMKMRICIYVIYAHRYVIWLISVCINKIYAYSLICVCVNNIYAYSFICYMTHSYVVWLGTWPFLTCVSQMTRCMATWLSCVIHRWLVEWLHCSHVWYTDDNQTHMQLCVTWLLRCAYIKYMHTHLYGTWLIHMWHDLVHGPFTCVYHRWLVIWLHGSHVWYTDDSLHGYHVR